MSTEGQEPDRNDLGPCSFLDAESVGPAGKRHFRLRVVADGGAAVLWLEKEQLQQLGIAIKQTLKTEMGDTESSKTADTTEDRVVDYEFKVVRLALGQDRDQRMYAILANGSGDDEQPVALAFWADHAQLDRLADRALEVCAAGRPQCPLCGSPLDEGKEHACPRGNGHLTL